MIVSSVAVIALAEEEPYTGSISEAQALLEAVDEPILGYNDATIIRDTKQTAQALVAVIEYVKSNNLSLAPGYAEFDAQLDARCIEFLKSVTGTAFDSSADYSYDTYLEALQVVKNF